MKTHELDQVEGNQAEGRPAHSRKEIALKLTAWMVPAAVLISATFFPLQTLVRQALVGIVLIWIYIGATIGFSFLE